MRLASAFLISCYTITLASWAANEPKEWSGIYPQLATFNNEGECGTGAVVPWADRLWVVSYGPHLPYGSSDKLYEITPDLQQIIHPESVGGTPANRLIHRESQQLLIGPYVIDAQRQVRVISPKVMPGRLTGTARHLTDSAHKVYYATMEDGLYEVDVNTLEVTGLIKEIKNTPKPGQTNEAHPASIKSTLPGYHGKGLYSGQGRLIIANNGEDTPLAQTNPNIASGALGEWQGSGNWKLIRRNQFTEVTGPGGIEGNAHPETDPIWTVGWDYRSLILMVMENGQWTSYRLPKASHTYDGAHGWNTEWPRIRNIDTGNDYLMTMHGMFWKFPATFSAKNSAGIAPRSTYLKIIGDFTRWHDRLVFGCDDAAKSEFLNKRPLKEHQAAPGQSQSNLWFTSLDQPDHLGPALGRGSVWIDEAVKGGQPSDAFLLNGFDHRALHVAHDGSAASTFTLEVDTDGHGQWTTWKTVQLEATQENTWLELPADLKGAWIRVTSQRDQSKASATFQYSNVDHRTTTPATIFEGISRVTDTQSQGAFVLTRGGNLRTLGVLSAKLNQGETTTGNLYELNANIELVPIKDPKIREIYEKNNPIPQGVLTMDEASVIYDEGKTHWRLPRSFESGFDNLIAKNTLRKAREAVTERDLFQAHGTLYELTALNAGGAIRMRPIASSPFAFHDFCSYRGLLVLTGINTEANIANRHIIRSADGAASVWVGAIDDLWQLGKPRGHGGPWLKTKVIQKTASDPYLFTGYDKKTLVLENHGTEEVKITVELDAAGNGNFSAYQTFTVAPGAKVTHHFPDWLNAYWLRTVSSANSVLSAQLTYE
jgi:hypothetical protein